VYDEVGIGITTYNRPDRLEIALKSVFANFDLPGVRIYLYDDGSDPEHQERIAEIVHPYRHQLALTMGGENKGVATAKNSLLHQMMADRKQFLFLMEDDQIVLSPKAYGLYIDAYRSNKKIHHFMFAHHGGLNDGVETHRISPRIEFYPNCIGSWCFYTKQAIKEVGYMDENFHNAMEHVEHTHRIIKAGMLGVQPDSFGWFPDAVGSRGYIREQEGALQDSVIRSNDEWNEAMIAALRYWKAKDPASFPLDRLFHQWGIPV
jgi:GT2 family glycosyltransferase